MYLCTLRLLSTRSNRLCRCSTRCLHDAIGSGGIRLRGGCSRCCHHITRKLPNLKICFRRNGLWPSPRKSCTTFAAHPRRMRPSDLLTHRTESSRSETLTFSLQGAPVGVSQRSIWTRGGNASSITARHPPISCCTYFTSPVCANASTMRRHRAMPEPGRLRARSESSRSRPQ